MFTLRIMQEQRLFFCVDARLRIAGSVGRPYGRADVDGLMRFGICSALDDALQGKDDIYCQTPRCPIDRDLTSLASASREAYTD